MIVFVWVGWKLTKACHHFDFIATPAISSPQSVSRYQLVLFPLNKKELNSDIIKENRN